MLAFPGRRATDFVTILGIPAPAPAVVSESAGATAHRRHNRFLEPDHSLQPQAGGCGSAVPGPQALTLFHESRTAGQRDPAQVQNPAG